LVVAAGISRYAGLLEYGNAGLLCEENADLFTDSLTTGRNYDDPTGFTNAYFHHADELRAEFETAGLRDIVVLGVEGPAAPTMDKASLDEVPALMPSAVLLARLLEADPLMMSASLHFLAFGWVAPYSVPDGHCAEGPSIVQDDLVRGDSDDGPDDLGR
jgi:hypothetical protein